MKFDFVSLFMGVILTLIIETLMLYFLGPSIRFSILFWLNQRSKSLRDMPIEIEYRRYSIPIIDGISLIDIKESIINKLGEKGISSSDQGVDILINKYDYASTTLNGYLHFSFSDFDEETISQIVIHFDKMCNYKTFSEDVFGLVNGVRSLEDSLRTTFPQEMVFRDELRCQLKNLASMTGILKKFTDKSIDNPIQYLYIKDSFNVEISSNEVIFRENIDSEILQLFKSLITMYY